MPLLAPVFFEGQYTHPRTGLRYEYAVTCQVAIDTQGRESMHVRGKVSRGEEPFGFVVMGRVDPTNSFIGREKAVALDCVGVACERDAGGSDTRTPARSAARRDIAVHSD